MIDEKSIENILRNGENNIIEIKKGLTSSLEKTVVAFSNTEGGTIILGYDEPHEEVVGIDSLGEKRAKQILHRYLEVCSIYLIKYIYKNLLVIEVEKSDKPIYLNGEFYYRVGCVVKSFNPSEAKKVSETIINSYRSVTLAEISDEVDLNKKKVKTILDSPLVGKIPAKIINGAMNYAPEEKKLISRNEIKKLSDVSDVDDLISYLVHRAQNIDGKILLHQYTTINAANAIISSGEFYVGSPVNMNDVLEYSNFNSSIWSNLFFTSFMETNDESIAMWSQYAQPWSKGVRLSIPVSKLKAWLKSIAVLYPADSETKKKTGSLEIKASKFIKSMHMVAYTNEDDVKKRGGSEEIYVGEASTGALSCIYGYDSMCGYVKNVAWNYEREVRFRFDIDESLCTGKNAVKGIIVPMPDEVLNSIEITKGPRLDESTDDWKTLLKTINKKGLKPPVESVFEGKLQKMACDNCEPNKYYQKMLLLKKL